MKISTKIKSDFSEFRKLRKKVNTTKVDVGYIDSAKHWNAEMSVAELAVQLHYWSPWGRDNPSGSFMLDESQKDQVRKWVSHHIQLFGKIDFKLLCDKLGEDLAQQIMTNIVSVDSPSNSLEWASEKGFDDPLRYGSRTGESNTLLDSVEYKVRRTT